jgi:hypothetical protein
MSGLLLGILLSVCIFIITIIIIIITIIIIIMLPSNKATIRTHNYDTYKNLIFQGLLSHNSPLSAPSLIVFNRPLTSPMIVSVEIASSIQVSTGGQHLIAGSRFPIHLRSIQTELTQYSWLI